MSAVLTNGNTAAPVGGQPVVFTLNGVETCTGGDGRHGDGVVPLTPKEAAGTYTLSASFAGDSEFLASSGSADFVVTHEETALSYTGATSAVNGQSVTLSGVLSTDDPAAGTGVAGRTVTFTLGSGASAQSCAGTTSASGAASCVVGAVSQTPGAVAVAASFAGDAFYQPATSPAATITVTTPAAPTALAVADATGDFGDATPVSAVLTNGNTAAPVGGQPVVFTLNGVETCTAVTDGTGTASCPLTPKEAAGTYTLSASFAGADGLLATSGTGRFVVTHEETALSYTGATSAVNGQSVTLSGVLSTDDPAAGTGVAGRTVTFTLGSGASAQSCAGTTSASGAASCVVGAVSQTPGAVAVAASFAGDAFYQPATSPAATVAVSTPATSGPVKDALVSKFNMNGKVKAKISTTMPSDLLVAFVGAGGGGDSPGRGHPSDCRWRGGQCGSCDVSETARVSGGGLSWTLVGRTNTQDGTAEIWTARAYGVVSGLRVEATLSQKGSPIFLTVAAFGNATGTGGIASASGRKGPPVGTLTTTSSPSWVWAVGNDPQGAVSREVPSGQTLQSQKLSKTPATYWVQSRNDSTAPAGTVATINDKAPTSDPWNLTLVEIL